jgi:alpha-L-fucosidase
MSSLESRKTLRESFLNLKFGMFVHFGLYSLGEEHEWHMCKHRMSLKAYKAAFLRRFDPDPAGMDQWVRTAKEMGATYVTCTSKHHDGFCLWDSAVPRAVDPDYTIRSTPFYEKHGKGVLDYLFEAGKKHGIRIGLYHSSIDWSWTRKPLFGPQPHINKPGPTHEAYMSYYTKQLVELGERYPDLLYFWFDGNHFRPDFPVQLRQDGVHDMLVQQFKGSLVVSNTGFTTAPVRVTGKTDLIIMENADHSNEAPGAIWPRDDPEQLPGEFCLTFNNHWGYNAADKNFKDPRMIAALVERNAARRSNTLLNFGPAPGGFIPDEQVTLAREIGALLGSNQR